MNSNYQRPYFREKVKIKGNALLLVGPIGTFFARLSKFFDQNNIDNYKISFPLKEYGFSKLKLIPYSKDISLFKEFLEKILIEKEIKHIFMYGNVLKPHRQALELVNEMNKKGKNIHTHIFELGYLRPNFVTLESKGINYDSSFILNEDFYAKQKPYKTFPIPKQYSRLRIRKIWKTITFINHCFKDYQIIEFDHKLQPKPSFIWYQIKGFLLKFLYKLSEYNLKKACFSQKKFFIVILQVSTDSQLKKGSNIKDNNKFIYKVIKNFSEAKLRDINLIFKHHPRDRGYINYGERIKKISKEFDLEKQVFYIHDYFLSKIFKNPRCQGTVLINSTVGYQSLFHSVPLKTLGISPYNIKGLSDQSSLTSFFVKPFPVDKLLFNKFYRYILENSQINGNFDGFFPFDKVFDFDRL